MFRRFYILILICSMFISCNRECVLLDGDVVTTFQATVQPEIVVRSGANETSEVIADMACMEIRLNDDIVYRQEIEIVPGTTQVDFPVKLVSGFKYEVYIWVGSEGYYNTSDLRNVSLCTEKEFDGKTPQFDAFFAYGQYMITQDTAPHEVSLKRPFAKVSFNSDTATAARIKFVAPTNLNLKTGQVSGTKNIEYTIESEALGIRAFDYVLAEENVTQLSYSFKVGDETEKTTMIPLARNTKTNILYDTTN